MNESKQPHAAIGDVRGLVDAARACGTATSGRSKYSTSA